MRFFPNWYVNVMQFQKSFTAIIIWFILELDKNNSKFYENKTL